MASTHRTQSTQDTVIKNTAQEPLSGPLTTPSATLRSMIPIITASTVGTAIEWYDFYLYGFLATTVFPSFFFPTLDPYAGTIAVFTTNFVGFVARPIGGAFFGWFGDRVGRKSTLIATLLLMGIATMLMGVLPGYQIAGIAAPITLACLRFLQGMGLGGEWAGSVLLSMEYSDDRRRGFWSSWPQTGVPIGLALAALIILLFKFLYPGEAFSSIGWRMPFFLSSALVIVGLYIRLRVDETPAFRKIQAEQHISRSPLLDVLRSSWREIILCALMRTADNAPFYIFTSFIPYYALSVAQLDPSLLYLGITLSALIGLGTIPLFALLSDRVGRKRWYSLGTIIMAAFAFPYFLCIQTRNPLLAITALAFSIGLCIAWLYGPQAALISERFRTPVRYSGTSLGYQLASITAGGPAPIIATYFMENRWHLSALAIDLPPYIPISIYMIATCLISLIAVQFLKEYTGKPAA